MNFALKSIQMIYQSLQFQDFEIVLRYQEREEGLFVLSVKTKIYIIRKRYIR